MVVMHSILQKFAHLQNTQLLQWKTENNRFFPGTLLIREMIHYEEYDSFKIFPTFSLYCDV